MGKGGTWKTKPSCPGERVLDYIFCFYDLGRIWFKQAPRWSMCMDRKRSVCRLASQTQLLTVCLTPPTPTLPVLSNVSSRTECETTEIKVASAALDNSDSTQSQNKGLFGSCLDWSCCPGCRQAAPAARSQKSDRWKQHMEAGGPPSILLLERHWPQQWGNLPSSQACSFMSDEICYQGRTGFFWLWAILQWQSPSMALGEGRGALVLQLTC